MTAAEVSSWHAILVAVVAVCVSSGVIGFARPGSRNGRLAFLQACTYTILTMLPELTADKPDGQAGIGIPIFLLIFYIVSWIALLAGRWIATLAKPRL